MAKTRTSAAQMQVLLVLQWFNRESHRREATVRELINLAQHLYYRGPEAFRSMADQCAAAFATAHNAWDFPDRFKRALRGLVEKGIVNVEEAAGFPRPKKHWPSMRDVIRFEGLGELKICRTCPKGRGCFLYRIGARLSSIRRTAGDTAKNGSR